MTHTELEVIDDVQFNELKELLEDDFVELVQNFLVDSKGRLVEIQEAYANNDNLSGYDAVHTLKGACANLGANALANVCYKLQMECRDKRISSSSALIKNVELELEKLTTEVKQRLG